METDRGSKDTDPLIPNLGTKSEGLTSGPGRFTPGKESRYPLNKRLGGHNSWSGRF